MNIEALINEADLKDRITQLKNHIQQHAISDVVDDAGNQYVDLVMEGGGMLGIALVGYSWALEEMGIRFMGLAGTSAGSINALLLAGMDEPAKAKSPQLLKELASMDFYEFVDGGKDARALIELALGPQRRFKALRIAWRAIRVKRQLCKTYGLNKGDAFTEWLADLLAKAGVRTLDELDRQLKTQPEGLRLRGGEAFGDSDDAPRGKLTIVAADITTETRVEFPGMAGLYWGNPAQESPAKMARASMAIPLFFEPLRISGIPNDDQAKQRWKDAAGYAVGVDPTAIIPETAMFVDGGIMSNFPIDAFHSHGRVPRMPTFGVKLEYDQRYKPPVKLPVFAEGRVKQLFPWIGAIFNSSRHTLDYEFVKKNPDFKHLVQYIPCTYEEAGKVLSYNWIDFNMPDEHKKGLFRQGALKAIEFIEGFSGPVDKKGKTPEKAEDVAFQSRWAYYKDLRKKLMEMN